MRTTYLSRLAGAFVALACVAMDARRATAQDTVATPRHVLSLDVTRLRPFTRSYDMVVHVGDSAHIIGQRDIALTESTYAGQPAWLMVETRSGIVPSIDSLVLAADLRPVHWSSELGRSRLAAEFSGDSVFGAVVTPAARRSMILGTRPDMLVSLAMIETIVGLLPLTSGWSDSAAVLVVDAGDATVLPAELAIIGEEADVTVGDSAGGVWLLAAKTDRGELQLWIGKASGYVIRIEQTLPAHVGSRLEFRPRAVEPANAPPGT